jgi:starvation-inducible DNA-binding protein
MKKSPNKEQLEQIKTLNILLATISIAISNTKAFHWNIVSDNFFVLHQKFSDLYDTYSTYQDDIAERIRALDSIPMVGYSNYLKNSKLVETKQSSKISEHDALLETIQGIENVIEQAKKVKQISQLEVVSDDETDNFMQEIIYELEKLLWQYKADII